jgi:hypothetical protein
MPRDFCPATAGAASPQQDAGPQQLAEALSAVANPA